MVPRDTVLCLGQVLRRRAGGKGAGPNQIPLIESQAKTRPMAPARPQHPCWEGASHQHNEARAAGPANRGTRNLDRAETGQPDRQTFCRREHRPARAQRQSRPRSLKAAQQPLTVRFQAGQTTTLSMGFCRRVRGNTTQLSSQHAAPGIEPAGGLPAQGSWSAATDGTKQTGEPLLLRCRDSHGSIGDCSSVR